MATVKDGQFGELAKYSTVELVIPAKVKNGVIGTTIENKASISLYKWEYVERSWIETCHRNATSCNEEDQWNSWSLRYRNRSSV